MNSMIERLPQQFVCVKLIQNPTTGEPDKIPCDPSTGVNIDAHQPSAWMTCAKAFSCGKYVGFVLTDDQPFFLIDLDKCRDASTGVTTPEALRVLSLFPGAYIEVSLSGTGYHVVGRCDKSVISGTTHQNKFTTTGGYPCEFYTGKRVMTVGGARPDLWHGNIETDHTAALIALVPPRNAPKGGAPALAFRPPTGIPDAVVITTALAAPDRRARASFGEAATFADLWQADPAVLARFFPPIKQGKMIDHSGADLAFMNALTYWCGGDPIQMDSIYRSSALFRLRGDGGAKWDRADYRNETLGKALSGRTEFYNWHAQPTTTASGKLGEYLTITDQQEHFAGCVYVVEQHRVLTPDHGLLAPEQFNAVYGGHRFIVSTGENSGTTKKAFEAFTENRGVRFPKAKRTGIHPDRPFGEIVGDTVNVYRKPPAPTPGDVTPFLVHLAKLIPDVGDRRSLLLWMAHVVQRPGKLTRWAPVLVGTPGNGKSFIGACIAWALGEQYRHMVRPGELSATHNGWITGKLFAQVEEIDLFTRRETIEILKPWITDPAINVRAMRTDSVTITNHLNWLFCTNHEGGVPKSVNDRRFMILHTAQQSAADNARDGLDGAYFDRLWSWAENGGFEHVAAYLTGYALIGFPGTAPDTSSTADAIAASRGPIEQAIADAIEEHRMGFRGGWISGAAVTRLFEEMREKRPGPRALRPALAALGYLYAGRSSRVIMTESEGEPRLYRYGLSKPADREARIAPDEYMTAQGIPTTVGFPPSIFQFPGKA